MSRCVLQGWVNFRVVVQIYYCGCSPKIVERKREEAVDFLPGRRHGALGVRRAAAPRVLVVATDVALAWLQRMQQRSVSPTI